MKRKNNKQGKSVMFQKTEWLLVLLKGLKQKFSDKIQKIIKIFKFIKVFQFLCSHLLFKVFKNISAMLIKPITQRNPLEKL